MHAVVVSVAFFLFGRSQNGLVLRVACHHQVVEVSALSSAQQERRAALCEQGLCQRSHFAFWRY